MISIFGRLVAAPLVTLEELDELDDLCELDELDRLGPEIFLNMNSFVIGTCYGRRDWCISYDVAIES